MKEDDMNCPCELTHCSTCGGHYAELGVLGGLYWVRCQDCGEQSIMDVPDVSVEPDDELAYMLANDSFGG